MPIVYVAGKFKTEVIVPADDDYTFKTWTDKKIAKQRSEYERPNILLWIKIENKSEPISPFAIPITELDCYEGKMSYTQNGRNFTFEFDGKAKVKVSKDTKSAIDAGEIGKATSVSINGAGRSLEPPLETALTIQSKKPSLISSDSNLRNPNMPDQNNSTPLVRLFFERATPTMIEDENDLLLEPGGGIEEFQFPGTENLSDGELSKWVHERLDVIFDGDLDDPSKFNSIVCIGIGNIAEGDVQYDENSGLIISGLEVFLKVDPSPEELDEDDLNDIFHAIVIRVKDAGTQMTFTEFEEYSAETIPSIESGYKICKIELL